MKHLVIFGPRGTYIVVHKTMASDGLPAWAMSTNAFYPSMKEALEIADNLNQKEVA